MNKRRDRFYKNQKNHAQKFSLGVLTSSVLLTITKQKPDFAMKFPKLIECSYKKDLVHFLAGVDVLLYCTVLIVPIRLSSVPQTMFDVENLKAANEKNAQPSASIAWLLPRATVLSSLYRCDASRCHCFCLRSNNNGQIKKLRKQVEISLEAL